MGRSKKPDILTRVAVRVVTGKRRDVNSTAVERELRDIADGKPRPEKGGAR